MSAVPGGHTTCFFFQINNNKYNNAKHSCNQQLKSEYVPSTLLCAHISSHHVKKRYSIDKARFPLPELTARVDG